MAIEEPAYNVLVSEGNFELRRYASYSVAETTVGGDFEAVGNEGFRRLVGYIGGKNRKKESISMTAPVSQKPASEKNCYDGSGKPDRRKRPMAYYIHYALRLYLRYAAHA